MLELSRDAVTVPAASLRALVAGAIDYAGLFPPAALGMREAVERYATHRASDDRWALGRFVVPASRLDELATVPRAVDGAGPGPPWRISVVLGADAAADVARAQAFNAAHAGAAVIDAAEAKVAGRDAAGAIGELTRSIVAPMKLFVEIPIDGEVAPLIAAIGGAGACAKMRTGGVTPDAFPAASDVARFMRRCAERHVPFKATAGLHHPIRARYRLSYEPDAPLGMMYGFVNVLVAAALAQRGGSDGELAAVLNEEDPRAFRFDDAGIRWGERFLTTEELLESHASFALSFGSCSFDEPMADLRRLALL